MRYLSFISCFLFSLTVIAQIGKEGTPLTWSLPANGLTNNIWKTLPEMDVEAILASEISEGVVKGRPYQFAVATDVDFNLTNSGRWTNLTNGDRLWVLGLTSTSALSLNVTFNQLNLPAGSRLYVYNAEETDYIGPLSSKDNVSDAHLTLLPLLGNEIIIEYFEPFAQRGNGAVSLSSVAQGFRSLEVPETADYACYEAFDINASGARGEELSSSTLLMLVDNGQRICSGTFLNNTKSDGRPLFVTTEKSLIGDPSSWVFVVGLNNAACSLDEAGGGLTCWNNAINGAQTLKINETSGLALLELNQSPKTDWRVFYAGWSMAEPGFDRYSVFQHALGRNQSYSECSQDLTNVQVGNLELAKVSRWDVGNTFSGSLGSPIFNSLGQYCGSFAGGNLECEGIGNDYFALLNSAWNDFSGYLNPVGESGANTQGFYPIFVEEDSRESNSGSVFVFPNPASDFIYIQNESEEAIERVEFIDAQGRKVSLYTPDLPYINVSDLPSGLYYVTIKKTTTSVVSKVMIRH